LRRKEEEIHIGRRKSRSSIRSSFNKIMDGWFGYVIYALLGIFIAFLLNQGLAIALDTDLPVVAVVSNSMMHDATVETNHYKWLEESLKYNRSYVDSWPIAGGFNVGDMPIVRGSKDYKIGDVIVYSISGQSVPIIHRIISASPDGTYVTKGDHNGNLLPFESSVSKQQIHGKVIFIIPKLGYFKVAISKIIWYIGGLLGR
jgi:hypothetical protein